MGFMEIVRNAAGLSLASLAGCRVVSESGRNAQGDIRIRIDTRKGVHPIDPRIYGASYAGARAKGARLSVDRWGGNNTSRYNWRENADNKGKDWFYQSIGDKDPSPAGVPRKFARDARSAGNQVMLTLPLTGWVAKLGPNRSKTWSYSVSKYGSQKATDKQWLRDSGNGVGVDGKPIAGNNPADANLAVDMEFFRPWVQMMRQEFGGIDYWLLDNEPGIWHATHRDILPESLGAEEYIRRLVAGAKLIREADPKAKICGPEEWGWTGFQHSPYDAWFGAKYGWHNPAKPLPERTARGGEDFLPWLLRRIGQEEKKAGMRLLDVVTVHYYPQGGEYGRGPGGPEMFRRRNESTRSLWDPNYVDRTWIKDKVRLIPRLKEWVGKNLPGREIGITEYSWGGDRHINGATAQADILGIFGREGLDIANRWTFPKEGMPAERAMAMYRTADGGRRGFGDRSVSCTAPEPDDVSAFAAIDTTDGSLTVMVVAKGLEGTRSVGLDIAGFDTRGAVGVWQLDSGGQIQRLPSPEDPRRIQVPAPSVTLLRLPTA